jgi:L-rhamnose mutarotase
VSASSPTKPVRFGLMLRIRPGKIEEYRRYHAAVWPEVLATISRCLIKNYSIFHHDSVLYSYFEYWGDDFGTDMKVMAADPATQRWWAVMEPMQDPLATRAPGEWWTRLEEVFHHD